MFIFSAFLRRLNIHRAIICVFLYWLHCTISDFYRYHMLIVLLAIRLMTSEYQVHSSIFTAVASYFTTRWKVCSMTELCAKLPIRVELRLIVDKSWYNGAFQFKLVLRDNSFVLYSLIHFILHCLQTDMFNWNVVSFMLWAKSANLLWAFIMFYCIITVFSYNLFVIAWRCMYFTYQQIKQHKQSVCLLGVKTLVNMNPT